MYFRLRGAQYFSSCDFTIPEQYFSAFRETCLHSHVWVQMQKRNNDGTIKIIGIRLSPCQWPIIENNPLLISQLEKNGYIIKPIGNQYYVEKPDAEIIATKYPLYIFGHLSDEQIRAHGGDPDRTSYYRDIVSVVDTNELYSGTIPTSEATQLIREDIKNYRFLLRNDYFLLHSSDEGLSAVVKSIDLIDIFNTPDFYTLYSFDSDAIVLSISKVRKIKKRLRKRYGAHARFDLTIRLPKELIKFAVGKDGKNIKKVGINLGCHFSVVENN